MRGNDFLDKMELVDLAYVEAADRSTSNRKKSYMKWGVVAACFCFFVISAFTMQKDGVNYKEVPPSITVFPTKMVDNKKEENYQNEVLEWTVHYNEVSSALDMERIYIQGYFTEELNEAELVALKPDRQIEWMNYFGNAGFDGEGNLIEVFLKVTTTLPDTDIFVTISEEALLRDYIFAEEAISSVCNNVKYQIYECVINEDNILLEADAIINDICFCFTMDTNVSNLEKAKADFEQVLECFTYYKEGNPMLSTIVAKDIPEWVDKTISYSEAIMDIDFGAYMLKNIPEGFLEEAFRRYKDQNQNYLSGLWSKGYSDVRWKVSYFTEKDRIRLTSTEDKENYDLSLYPIPRASSVPRELWEVVDNPIFYIEELTLDILYARSYWLEEVGEEDSWNINFSVKYGDILVEIRTEGVTPEWIYKQLMEFPIR